MTESETIIDEWFHTQFSTASTAPEKFDLSDAKNEQQATKKNSNICISTIISIKCTYRVQGKYVNLQISR